MNNFQKTVNLRDQFEKERARLVNGGKQDGPGVGEDRPEKAEKKKTVQEKKDKAKENRTKELERLQQINEEKRRQALQTIERVEPRPANPSFYKALSAVLFIILVAVIPYFVFVQKFGDKGEVKNPTGEVRWYSIELVNGETYYGQVTDTKADPLIVSNVYYNYDQLNQNTDKSAEPPSGNLRLVKRGKETQGGDGNMEFIRANVLHLEPLGQESKVLKAILDYENN